MFVKNTYSLLLLESMLNIVAQFFYSSFSNCVSLSRNKINIGKSFSKCVCKISVRPLLCYSSQSIDSYYSVSLTIDSHMGNFQSKNIIPRSKLQLESCIEVVVFVLKKNCLLIKTVQLFKILQTLRFNPFTLESCECDQH